MFLYKPSSRLEPVQLTRLAADFRYVCVQHTQEDMYQNKFHGQELHENLICG